MVYKYIIKMVFNLLVIFSSGVSLFDWKKKGILNRELSIYKRMARKGVKLGFVTYGNRVDLQFLDKKDRFELFAIRSHYKGKFLPVLTPFLIVLFNKGYFRKFNLIKSNQMMGSSFLWFLRIFYRKKVILRCGYEKFKNELFLFKNFRRTFFKLIYLVYLYCYEWFSYRICDHVIFSNQVDKNYAIRRFKLNPKKASTIPNNIDIKLFKSLDIPKKKKSVIYVGNFNEFKNLENLIISFKNLEDFSLSLVGSGELNEDLVKIVELNGLENRISFLGRVPNQQLPSFYNKHELFIIPSLIEGNPKSLLEAMSCGIPCIGSNVKGINTIINDKINGYLCEPNYESIAKAIKFAHSNSEGNKLIVQNALQYIKKFYSIDQIYKKEFKLYEKLLSKN